MRGTQFWLYCETLTLECSVVWNPIQEAFYLLSQFKMYKIYRLDQIADCYITKFTLFEDALVMLLLGPFRRVQIFSWIYFVMLMFRLFLATRIELF